MVAVVRPSHWAKMQKTLLLVLGLVLGSVHLYAQSARIPYRKGNRGEVHQWNVLDIVFASRLPPHKTNPFSVHFSAAFTGPKGESLTVPGFYNGDGEFILRFGAPQPGKWTYLTTSSRQELAGLTGEVLVKANADKAQHGMVTVAKSHPERFVYEDSSSYFSLAFELDWLFALDYHNPSDIPKTRELIQAVKNNGFNQVVMNVYAYDVGWKTATEVPREYEYRKPDFFPFLGSNEKPDFSALNPQFFRHFDRVIQHLHEAGIVAHLMIYVWNKKVNWPAMYSAADNGYFDYVIARYQAFPNIIWDVSKEALDYGRCDIPYINERIARIRNKDAYKRLVTVHDYEYCSREPDRVDFISIQSWRSDLYSYMLEAGSRHAGKPVVNIEHGGYERGPYRSFYGNYTSAETCLLRNYQCLFAGVYSTYYWQNTSWNIVVYNPEAQPTEARPRFEYYQHMNALFERYDFNELFPSKQKITTNSRTGADNLGTSGYVLSNGKNRYLYLLPAEAEFTNAVVPKPAGEKMQLTFFNPFTGKFTNPEKRRGKAGRN